jgi:thioredoxin-like negative regulator of GroEL
MNTTNRIWTHVAAWGLLFLVPSSAFCAAQEVQWRPDYNTARREAADKNRPILVDVGTEHCFWCKRLDASTFRDPKVVSVINDQFIPVRIDASREPAIAEALGIQSYPTIVLASADGKILKMHAGFMEAGPFHDTLQHVLAALPRQDVLVKNRTDPQPAAPLVQSGPPDSYEVKWRQDYNTARREAQEKGLPLVLDFGTQNCVWCNKQDATTLRDPSIVRLMNDRFVPIKIDAEKEASLARDLRIQNYPTIVLAAPDGRILGTFEGFQEAARLTEYLQRALASVANPEWMVRDYQAAAKAIAASDYARAIALLKSISEDGKDRPIQVKSRQLLQDMEQQATGRLTRAHQQEDKGSTLEAMETLTELVRLFAGTQAAAEAGQMLSTLAAKPEIKNVQRTRRARELLAQAREDYRTQQYLCCLERCEVLAGSYADLPEGSEAIQLASEIKNNPEWMRRACDDLSDRLSMLLLAQAETWLKKGQPQQAASCLERVVQAFPGTRQAEAAQGRLAQIQGQPTRQAEYQKP